MLVWVLASIGLLWTPTALGQDGDGGVGRFEVVFGEGVFGEAYTGPLFVAFSERGEPREAAHGWFNPPPVMRVDVEGVSPGGSVTVRVGEADGRHPAAASAFAGEWRVQAFVRTSLTGAKAGVSAGDVYSGVAEARVSPGGEGMLTLRLTERVPAMALPEHPRARLFEMTSERLSGFHGFDYPLRAGVLLPENYEAGGRYPVIVSVTGFGGDARSVMRFLRTAVGERVLARSIIVVPDATNRGGHSVFADSANTGPWGAALVEELLPAIDEAFGGMGPEHRYVTGVSSGGWSSLWLQLTYPDAFNGVWSHVPDPIDFHDFQQINLYEPLANGTPRNMYIDESGASRPLARRGEQVLVSYEDFVRREDVLNPGGQIASFEWTFSPRGADGMPARVFDRETGEIDHAVAASWRKYDIAHLIETRWEELKGRLAGRVHIYAGEMDNFYLEGAVERLEARLGELGVGDDELHVEVVPGMGHSLHGPGQEDMERTIERDLSRASAPS